MTGRGQRFALTTARACAEQTIADGSNDTALHALGNIAP